MVDTDNVYARSFSIKISIELIYKSELKNEKFLIWAF
jgi:hypothetical protein